MSKVAAITSRSNPLLVHLRRLAADGSAYRRHGEVWLEGEHLAGAYLQHGGAPLQAIVDEPAWATPRLRALASAASAVAVLPTALMAQLSALGSAPPIAFVVRWPGPGALQADAPSVVLDRVQDAGNVGSILRSASAFGFTQVIALAGTAAPWSPKVLRAAMGAHFALRLVEAADASAIGALRVPLVATSPHAAAPIHRAALPWPCGWVLGHEGQGVAPELLARCALAVAIPQPGGEESLNVAAAAAVCFYESVRQRAAT